MHLLVLSNYKCGVWEQTDRQTNKQTTAVLDLRVVDLLKDVFKSTVVRFEDGILGATGGGVRIM